MTSEWATTAYTCLKVAPPPRIAVNTASRRPATIAQNNGRKTTIPAAADSHHDCQHQRERCVNADERDGDRPGRTAIEHRYTNGEHDRPPDHEHVDRTQEPGHGRGFVAHRKPGCQRGRTRRALAHVAH